MRNLPTKPLVQAFAGSVTLQNWKYRHSKISIGFVLHLQNKDSAAIDSPAVGIPRHKISQAVTCRICGQQKRKERKQDPEQNHVDRVLPSSATSWNP
jgi:hypothetical protein